MIGRPSIFMFPIYVTLVGVFLGPVTVLLADSSSTQTAQPVHVPDVVLKSQRQRIQMVDRVTPSVVAIYNDEQRAGGSGVLIDQQGYGLTNYHVVAGMLTSRRGYGGLSDGRRYDLHVLGIDPIGDVAMFRLLGRKDFPFSTLGNSDLVRVGDTALALGNPFSLTEDEKPTLTLGLVTGIHRYQWGVKGNLTYSDCIQVDAPINPGNSGGPLFNEDGRVIGINGRISINTRGRFNVGFGYAITTNQIKRFMPLLRAGGLATHGSFEATVEDDDRHDVLIDRIRSSGPAYQAGLRRRDRIIAIDAVLIESSNHFVSLLGTYPGFWNLLVDFERAGRPGRTVVPLRPVAPKLTRAYAPDGIANGQQVDRVIGAFRNAVGIKTDTSESVRYQWHACRTYDDTMTSTRKTLESYTAWATEDGSLLWQEYDEEAQPARLLEINTQQVTLLGHADRRGPDIRSFERRVLTVLHLVYQRLFQPVDPLNMIVFDHDGANVDYRLGDDGSPVDLFFTDEMANVEIMSREVEELISPIGQGAVVRLAFDTQTHKLSRAVIWHQQAGTLGTIHFSNYQPVAGVLLPQTIYVRGQGYRYEDALSDWEVLP